MHLYRFNLLPLPANLECVPPLSLSLSLFSNRACAGTRMKIVKAEKKKGSQLARVVLGELNRWNRLSANRARRVSQSRTCD